MSNWWSRPANRLAVFRAVQGPGDIILLIHVFCFAVAVPILMRLPLTRVGSLLEPRAAPHTPQPARVEKIIALVQAVLQAGRPLVRRGCLTRGVTLYYFLRRAGIDVSLCFGMGASTEQRDGFDGHCWLVRDGEPFLEPLDPRPLYTEMYVFRPGFRHQRPERRPA